MVLKITHFLPIRQETMSFFYAIIIGYLYLRNLNHILLDEWGGFGYSCITSVDENTIGILYEGSQSQMVFQQVKLSEIIGHKK